MGPWYRPIVPCVQGRGPCSLRRHRDHRAGPASDRAFRRARHRVRAYAHPEFVSFMVEGSRRWPVPQHAQRLHYAASEGHDSRNLLPTIAAPTLVIHGEDDHVNPTANAALLAARGSRVRSATSSKARSTGTTLSTARRHRASWGTSSCDTLSNRS